MVLVEQNEPNTKYFLHNLKFKASNPYSQRTHVPAKPKTIVRRGLVHFINQIENAKVSSESPLQNVPLTSSDPNPPSSSSCCLGQSAPTSPNNRDPTTLRPAGTRRDIMPDWTVPALDDYSDDDFHADARVSVADSESSINRTTERDTIRVTRPRLSERPSMIFDSFANLSSVLTGRSTHHAEEHSHRGTPNSSTSAVPSLKRHFLPRLAMLQLFAGNWPISTPVLELLRFELVQLEQMLFIGGAQTTIVNDVWITVLILAELSLSWHHAYDQWYLMANKALCWLAQTIESPISWLRMARLALSKSMLNRELYSETFL